MFLLRNFFKNKNELKAVFRFIRYPHCITINYVEFLEKGKLNEIHLKFTLNMHMYMYLTQMKSHLSVDWMVTEWWRNGDWMVTGKVDFSRISATIQWPFSWLNGRHISVTFKSAYFLKNKITPNADWTRAVRTKGKVR